MNTEPMTALTTIPGPVPTHGVRLTPSQCYSLWLTSLDSPRTKRTYEGSIASFAGYLRAPTAEAAVELLLTLDRGGANALAEGWRAALREKLAPNSVNARLTALRALCTAARRFAVVDWSLEVENVRSELYRDCAGPGADNVKKMREACAAQGDTPKAKRDYAALRLLSDLALRSMEILGLTIDDVDLAGGRVRIVGKGRTQGEWLTMPDVTRDALKAWLTVRGDRPGFVFHRLDRAAGDDSHKPMLHRALWELVGQYGRAAGVKHVRPHGIRHSSISAAAERTGGDIVAISAFARHRNPMTSMRYIDHLKDKAGAVARLVAQE